jgi:acyl carrier protein
MGGGPEEKPSMSAEQSLRDRLIGLIEENNPETCAGLRDDTSLIRSGLIDSMGLFNLALWIERETGSKLDLNAFDISTEWETIGGILSFICRNCRHLPR